MLSLDTLLPAARQIEADVQPALARYDAAMARLHDHPDAPRLGPALDRLAGWSDMAPTLTGLLASADGAPAENDDARMRRMAAASRRQKALQFMQAVIARPYGGDTIAHPGTSQVVRGIHQICHPAGLDTVHRAGAPVRFEPGAWRRWSLADAPAPAVLERLMAAWEAVFSSPMWDQLHPVIHAALAADTLARLAPFPTGNGAAVRLVGYGILRRSGAPFCPSPLTGQAPIAGEPGAAPSYADVAARCERFAAGLAGDLARTPARLDRLQGNADDLARAMPGFPARYTLSRGELARSLATRPLTTPAGFARREWLSRAAAERILKRLIATGHLQPSVISGHRVVFSRSPIALLRELAEARQVTGGTAAPAAASI